ncbi:MAG TPA: hypothetical protein H9815_00965, partial [Candidatus Ruania gallistercoris]|nr:hypothetical protein [Candidatus Ruania gallistercoris]
TVPASRALTWAGPASKPTMVTWPCLPACWTPVAEPSAAMGDSYLIAVIPTDALHLMMLVLLWVPRSVREFFAAHRRQRSTAQVQ